MSEVNYSRFLEFLTRLSRGEIAEVAVIDSLHPFQFRWQDGYIEWRQTTIPTLSEWVRDAADVDHHLHIASGYPITWLPGSNSPPHQVSQVSHIRRVEL